MGLRLDGLFALELWDLIVSAFGNISHVSDNLVVMFTNVISLTRKSMLCKTLIPSNVQSGSQEALLHVFEDNEAVIEMILFGRSPTMRHVSRTHRVACDWSNESIWTLKSKSNTSTPKANSQTSYKGEFHT